ncbi:MAG: type II 3-dehydroquinate dehydratase [Saprospiraceae bacterium]|nr:type II 3-dehydroquinate dehydratase [Saprospiraceae bacterium]
MKILIINGPNLNLLGKREPEIYGNTTFENFYEQLKIQFPGVEFDYFQSNVEGLLINKLHEVGFMFQGIIFNAGAYTHTSLALADAIAAISTPVIEVHLSNVYAREEIRHNSTIASNCIGSISGFGMRSYELGVLYFTGFHN